MSRKPLLGSTDISEGFLVLSCATGRLPPSVGTTRVSWCIAATWDLWSSRGLLPRRGRFGGSQPTEHRALYRVVRDFTSQGSGQRVRRPDNISSVLLTVAFSQSHHPLVSFQHPWVSRVSEESPRLWVGFCYHVTRFHRHARQMLGPLSVSEKVLTLAVSRVHVLFR